MAEAAAIRSAIQVLTGEATFLWGVTDQVDWIAAELTRMKNFLQDADEKRKRNSNVRTWLMEITEVAYDAEDLMDAMKVKKYRRQQQGLLKRYCLICNHLIYVHRVGIKITQIKARVQSIAERRVNYSIENILDEGIGSRLRSENLRWRRRSSPHLGNEVIVGLDDDVRKLQEVLTCTTLDLSVIPIVGMGGLGKTTLTKIIYNSDDIKSHFHICIWVCVSETYTPGDIMHQIEKQLNKISGKGPPESDEGAGERVYTNLQDYRYLIVMDDIWTTEVWSSLESYFPNTESGSKIVFTTRSRDVALNAHPSYYHQLAPLHDHASWKLFSSKAFRNGACPSSLEKLAKDFLRKCDGLPLAIVVLGGLLSTKDSTVDAWSRVLEGLNWHLNQEETMYHAVLGLSYYDLPVYLKPCFLYFGMFPESYDIPLRRLIGLWIAEGFVEERDETTLEDVAKDYIDELAGRNMILLSELEYSRSHWRSFSQEDEETTAQQKEKTDISSNFSKGKLICKVHNLVRELSLLMAKKDHFLHVHETGEISKVKARRFGVHQDVLSSSSPQYLIHHLRTYIHFDLLGGKMLTPDLGVIFQTEKGYKWLRVLDLEGTYKPRLPKELGKLVHLKYLGLRRTWLDALPSSVSKLSNLLTLDLKSTAIKSLSSIWGMVKLTHLYLNWEQCKLSINIQTFSDCFPNLQTLWGVSFRHCISLSPVPRQFCKLRKVGLEGDFNNLYFLTLSSTRLENLKLCSRGKQSPILNLPILPNSNHLVKIHLEGRLRWFFGPRELPENLTTLVLVGSELPIDPMAVLEKQPNLRILKLWYNSFTGNTMLCTANGFRSLEILELCWLKIKRWDIRNGSMPNLRMLEINKCNELISLPELIHLTQLKELRLPALSDRLKGRLIPNLGKDWYKIQHIPFVMPPLV